VCVCVGVCMCMCMFDYACVCSSVCICVCLFLAITDAIVLLGRIVPDVFKDVCLLTCLWLWV